jgi:hypothetical protein
MRLHEIKRTPEEWVAFFVAVRKLGITTLHSSSEYDSFPLFRDILRRVKRDRPDIGFRHMVKLGEPHFHEGGFDGGRLATKVDTYRDALAVDCIDDIQWMWRDGLEDEGERLKRFEKSAVELGHVGDSLKAEGKIKRLFCFPYTPGFALAAVENAAIDGLAVYRNIEEAEYESALASAAQVGKPCIAIRPFNGGKALASGEAGQLLRYALEAPAVEAAILSSSSLPHLRSLAETFM